MFVKHKLGKINNLKEICRFLNTFELNIKTRYPNNFLKYKPNDYHYKNKVIEKRLKFILKIFAHLALLKA